jgi:PTH1 family peptidyl-tRNA hydrolase
MINWLIRLFKPQKIESDPMKYLVVGLGNIGSEYEGTRHNIGFDVVDYLAKDASVSFSQESNGDLCEFKYKGRTMVLLKPSLYMNRSGKSVKYWLDKYKILPENLLILVDDMNLDLGKMRLRAKGSDGGHNGLKDIQEKLGSNEFIRLRLGIGNDFHKGQQVNFVLGKWKSHEQEPVSILKEKAAKAVLNFATIGMKHTMDSLNH